MTIPFRAGHRIFVYSEYIDLRSGFDRLSMIVREKMQANLLEGDLFVFLGNHRRKCKAICYDGSGVVLINKRLEHGKFMRISELESGEITREEFELFFRGSVIRRASFGTSALTRAHGLTHSRS
jgi:IS66 Orf2 like protein